jgi:hypothetical protein
LAALQIVQRGDLSLRDLIGVPSQSGRVVHTGSAYRGGPHALLLDRHVHALTGRTLDRFTGKYALKKVEISD